MSYPIRYRVEFGEYDPELPEVDGLKDGGEYGYTEGLVILSCIGGNGQAYSQINVSTIADAEPMPPTDMFKAWALLAYDLQRNHGHALTQEQYDIVNAAHEAVKALVLLRREVVIAHEKCVRCGTSLPVDLDYNMCEACENEGRDSAAEDDPNA